MADERIEVDVVVDAVGTEKLNNVSKSVSNLGDAVSATGKKLSGGTQSLRNFVNGFTTFNNDLNKASRHLTQSLSGFDRVLRRGFRTATREIKSFVKEALEAYTELSEQHAKTTGAMFNNYDTSTITGKQQFSQDSDSLQRQAIKLAKGTHGGNDIRGSLYNPIDVSEAQTELVKAGVPTKDILNTNVLKDIMEFAQANDLKTGDAVKFAVSLGSQFKYKYNDWGTMLDMVSHTADLSTIDVKDVVNSMKYAGGITSGLNRQIEEVLAMIAEMGQFGLYGSQSGGAIQALYTRLLTQDTTVVTEAQAELAPPKALKAFYDFSKYAKSDGSGLSYNDIKNAKSYKDFKDLSGNLKPMDEVVEELDNVMKDLNDEEQAWFAKKFFGLYQMKGAYALINGNQSDVTMKDYERRIKEESTGTNENKLNQLLDSQYGKNKSFSSLIETTKTDVGMKLSPVVNTIRDELFRYIADEGNYNINFDSIRNALNESTGEIELQYGKAIGGITNSIGSMTIDLTEVGSELGPEILDGIGRVISKILDGDILGMFEEWNTMIGGLDLAVDGLPEELQDLGDKVVGLIEVFGALTTLDIGAKIIEAVTSVVRLIQIMGGAVIKAGSVIVQGGNGGDAAITGGKGGKSGKGKSKSTRKKGSNNTTYDRYGNIVDTTWVEGGESGTGAQQKTGSKFMSGAGNIIKFGTGIVGGYYGSQIGSDVGGEIEKNITGDEEASGIGNIVGGIAGSLAGYKLTDKLMTGVGKALMKSYTSGTIGNIAAKSLYGLDAIKAGGATASQWLSADALVGGTAGSSAGAVVGSLILPAAVMAGGIYVGYDTYKDSKEKDKNRKDVADVVNSGETPAYDIDGSLIRSDDGNLITHEQLSRSLAETAKERQKRINDNKYTWEWNNNEYSMTQAAPEEFKWYKPSTWSSKKRDAYKLQQEQIAEQDEYDKKAFENVQEYLHNKTGVLMPYQMMHNNRKGIRDINEDINKGSNIDLSQYTDITDEFKNTFTIGTKDWANEYITQLNESIKGYTYTNNKGEKKDLKINNDKDTISTITKGYKVSNDPIGTIQSNVDKILNDTIRKSDQYKMKMYGGNFPTLKGLSTGVTQNPLLNSSIPDIMNRLGGNATNKGKGDIVAKETEKSIQINDNSTIQIQPTTTPVTVQPNVNVNVSVDKDNNVKMTPSQANSLFNLMTQYSVNKSKSYNTDGKSK